MINDIHDITQQDTPEPAPKKNLPTSQKPRRRRNKHDYQYWLAEPYNAVRGETALWVAVITQAMMDALSNSRNPETIACKQAAIAWLTGNSRDFHTVCHYAGMDPDYVRKKAKRSLANPTSWRAEAGKGSRYEERKAYRKKIKALQQNKTHEKTPPQIITGCWE